MTLVAEAQIAPDSIVASVNYVLNTGGIIYNFSGGPGSTKTETNIQSDPRRVTIRNGRVAREAFDLDKQGFKLVDHATRMGNFFDAEELRRVYHPEMIELVKAQTGARRVVVFDHTLRTADDDKREALKIREVVRRVHNDYTEWSARQRVRDVLPEEADALIAGRFAVVQVWRSISWPVETHPLALCDAGSVAPEDLIVAERRYPGRVGQTYSVAANPAHAWTWFPRMTRDEALVFKVYESATDRARFVPHTAFDDPTTPANARPRESIEIRTFAFF